jgi:hypothetical protein
MTDFHKMSAMMKELFPSNPEADKQALRQMANAPVQDVAPQKDYVNESVNVPQGSMPIGLDSVSDFAKLAGIVTEGTQKTGSAGQAKGSDAMPKTSKPSSTGEQPHPLKDKLVGEDDKDSLDADLMALTPGVSAIGGALDPDIDFSALIARGLKKAAQGIVLNAEERDVIKPYIGLLVTLMTDAEFRGNLIAMQKQRSAERKSREEPEEPETSDDDEETKESGLQYYTGVKKYGKEGMEKLAQAGREGASEEELGRIKDKYKKTESIKERLYRELNKRR